MGTNISEIPAAYIYCAEDVGIRFLLSVGTCLAKTWHYIQKTINFWFYKLMYMWWTPQANPPT